VDKQTFTHVGYNSRLDEVQAAILRVLLPELDGWCEGRRAAAREYEQGGLGSFVGLPAPPPDADPAWHLFVVTHAQADELLGALGAREIGARGYYRVPLHRQPALAGYAPRETTLPVTEELAASNLALPMGPALPAGQVREVVAAVAAFAD
jgi:dTDP-4-amino-4,6-dideoxygalactose transaminase